MSDDAPQESSEPGFKMTHGQVVGQMSYFERADVYPTDAAEILHRGNRKYGNNDDDSLVGERGRLFAAGLIDFYLQRERWEDARQFLTSYSYLAARLAHFGIRAVLTDFERYLRLAPGSLPADVRLVFDTLAIAQPMLQVSPSQLPEQLLGRLHPDSAPRIQQLLEAAQVFKQTTPWLRPIACTWFGSGEGLQRILEDRSARPQAIAYSSDGSILAVAAASSVRLWDTRTMTQLKTLVGHQDDVIALLVSADDRFIVAAARADALYCWPTCGGAVRQLYGHQQPVDAIINLPDGRILSAGRDGLILAWNVTSGEAQTFGKLAAPIHTLACSSDGRFLVSVSGARFFAARNTLTVWDTKSGSILRTIPHEEGIDAVAISGDDRCVLVAMNNRLWRWELPNWDGPQLLNQQNCWRIAHLVTSRDGRWAVTGDTGGVVRTWDLHRGGPPHLFHGHRTLISGLALDHVSTLATVGDAGTLRLWKFPPAARTRRPFAHDDAVNYIKTCVFHEKQLAVTASDDHSLAIWDLDSLVRISTPMHHDTAVRGIVVFPQLGRVVSASWDGTLAIWDLATGHELQRLTCRENDERIAAMVVDHQMRRALTVVFDGPIRSWDLETGTALGSCDPGIGSVNCLTLAADGQRALAGGQGWAFLDVTADVPQVLARSRRQRRRQLVPPADLEEPLIGRAGIGVNAACHVPGSSRYVLATSSGQVLTVRANRVLATWQENFCGLADVAVSPDGKTVATVGGRPIAMSDDTLRIWDSSSGQVVARFIGDGPLNCCAFTSNGRSIIVGDDWGRLHLFAVERPRSSPPPT